VKVSIKDLSVTYNRKKKALQKINVELKSPNFVGLLGPNGAGKSTFMKVLVSRIFPTSGEIKVNDVPLFNYEKEMKKKLGYLPQNFGLYDELSVYQFLDYMASLKELGKNAKENINQVIEQVNLQKKRKEKIRNLSGGQRQRVGIAQALLGDSELIILDEPTVGLDPEERIRFRNIFSKMAHDKIVLLSTHIIDDIQAVCRRIIVINEGKILFDGTSPELIQLANGHVGLVEEKEDRDIMKKIGNRYKSTSKLFTKMGVSCRVIAEKIESSISLVEPTLEDAYTYVIAKYS
jgi:ABC-type multidrug transport system ATPase subunit